MLRRTIFLFAFTAMAVLGIVSCEVGDKGRCYNVGGLTVIELEGSWHDMGRQYGKLAVEQMHDVLEYVDSRLSPYPGRADSAAAVLAENLYSNYPDYLKDFFSGVSETSGLTLERIKLCNAAEYVEGLFYCSAIAAWDDYGCGKLVFGRNYDAQSYQEIFKDLVVTIFHPEGMMTAVTVGYAGELYCVNGLNEKGIFLELNNGMPSAGEEIHWELCPSTTLLFELLFEAESLDDVDRFFHNNRSFSSFIIGVADRNEARSYEWCYDGVNRGDEATEDGLMISTNHHANETWTYDIPRDEDSWNSITRRSNLLELAGKNKGEIDVDRMKEIISTTIDDGGPMHDLTRYQIIAVPEDMKMLVNVPDNKVNWVEISL